ncbi:hypothetical protein [Halioxenophilus sp. WMMB6]|uniref:hypothetical protein n=1 Tax=Halioxenophilus sp. WMMB6 TaxID=3073815 RepID=UPI00295E4009|nr:hypothetical protein [Halioxenophilus sp. WMMB6]
MIATRSALDFNSSRVAISPINFRETCVLLMEHAPKLASQLQSEIRHQRLKEGPIAEDFLGLHLNIETIGLVIVELTKIGERALFQPKSAGKEKAILKELIECWLSLAEWILSDLEITDTPIH